MKISVETVRFYSTYVILTHILSPRIRYTQGMACPELLSTLAVVFMCFSKTHKIIIAPFFPADTAQIFPAIAQNYIKS